MDPQGLVIVDLPDEPPARPPRRIPASVGVAVLLLIALALTTFAGVRERPVAGSAVPGPRAALPAVGDCLRWDVEPERQTIPVGGTVRIIGCTELHQGQVLQAWRIGAQPSSSTIEATCSSSNDVGSFGVYSDSWDGAFGSPSSTVITSGTEGVDFLACVLTIRGSDPPGALFSLVSDIDIDVVGGGAPAEVVKGVRQCLDGNGLGVGCQQPHTVERIGTFTPGVRPGRTRPTTSCTEYAAAVVGSRTPFRPAVGLSVREVRTGAGGLQVEARDFCDVVAPAGSTLVGTVVGLGDAPLPLG